MSAASIYLGEDDDDEGENDIDGDDFTETELLRRLSQSQARMEQIKRMLVNQRGFIVQSLKMMAEGNANQVSRMETRLLGHVKLTRLPL